MLNIYSNFISFVYKNKIKTIAVEMLKIAFEPTILFVYNKKEKQNYFN